MTALLRMLRSMRFAIGVLCVVAVAATIGSILAQNQPAADYVGRYGTYWSALFALCGLTDVYHTPWFLLLLAFMAASTALCLWQRTPGMWREMRGWRLERSLAALRRAPHRTRWQAPGADPTDLAARLRKAGYAARLRAFDGGWLLAGRRGAGRRVGYLLVHGAIVLICVGGLVDGNVPQQWHIRRGTLVPAPLHVPAGEAPATARLPRGGGAFRAMVTLARGGTADSAQLAAGDGYLVQPLPFALHLRDFAIEHYPNGQPRDFVSTLEIVDGARRVPVTLRVNRPFTYRGVTLYQSGFDDGGSIVTLRLAGTGGGTPRDIGLRVGTGAPLLLGGQPFTLEAVELKMVNPLLRQAAPASWHVQPRPGEHTVDGGPSLSFRLRDNAGQATAYVVYQRALEIDGRRWFVMGRGEDGARHYLRVPADDAGTAAGYMAWAAALQDPAARTRAAAAVAAAADDPQLAASVRASTAALLERFAAAGLPGVARFVPPGLDERRRAASGQLYLELLERGAARLAGGLPAQRLPDALAAYSESRTGAWPALVELVRVAPVPAAVLQVTRAPGAVLVYLGTALLAAGVCAMTFIRERRLWLHWRGGELLLVLEANRPGTALGGELAACAAALGAPRFTHPITEQVPHDFPRIA